MFWNFVLWIASFALNLLLTPKPQDAKPAALEDFEFPTAEEGRSIPVLFGTKTISGPNVVWYGDLKTKAIKGPRRYGLFGPRVTLGWKYFLGIHMILCHGVVDMIRRITVDGKPIWRGWNDGGRIKINEPNLFGGKESGGGIKGDVDIEMGGPTQGKNDYLQGRLGNVSAHRGVVGAVLRQVYLGNTPYIKPWEFKIQRVFTRTNGEPQWYQQTAGLGEIDVSDTALYIAVDVSGSMFGEPIEMERAALTRLLDLIKENYPTRNLDIRMVAWDDQKQSAIEIKNIKPEQFQKLKDWVATETQGWGNTDFSKGIEDAKVFFDGPPDKDEDAEDKGAGTKRRVIIFVTDGEPTINGSAELAHEMLQQISGKLEVFAFNIALSETYWTEMVDNTPNDVSWETYVRAFNPDGTPYSDAFRANRLLSVGDQSTDGWISRPMGLFWRFSDDPYGMEQDFFITTYKSRAPATSQWYTRATHWDVDKNWGYLFWGFEYRLHPTSTTSEMYASVAGINEYDKYVVTWTDESGLDGSGAGIFCQKRQRLNPDLYYDPVIQVNTTVDGTQKYSRIVALLDGGWFIAWQSYRSAGTNYDILAQRFANDGSMVGPEMQLSDDYLGMVQGRVSLARLADGKVVAVWLTDSMYIEQKVLDPDADMATVSYDVVNGDTFVKNKPEVAPLTGGGHVVVWAAQDRDGSGSGIFAQLYDDEGVKNGPSFQVNTTTTGEQSSPDVAEILGSGIMGGGFAVVWQSYGQDGSGYGIYSQAFDRAGTKIGGETRVNEKTYNNQVHPTVLGGLLGGRFIVGWEDPNGLAVPIIGIGESDQMVSTLASAFMTNFDMNPAHIIRECLTDRVWGMGYNESDIDEESFVASADTLFEEGFGLTLLWQHEEEVREFITTILSHIDAMLYVSRQTGKFVLKLIRPDYLVDELPIVTEEDIVNWTEVKRRQPHEAVNSVTVVFYDKRKDKEATVAVHNPAAVKQAGGMIPAQRQYPGISKRELAIRVATRDLRSLSSGLADARVTGKRTLEFLNPGDPFRLVSSRHGFDGEVMRVTEMNLGDGRKNEIAMRFVQDVFHLDTEVLVDDSSSDSEVPTDLPPVVPRLVHEMPYHELVKYIGPDDTDAMLGGMPTAGLVQIAGSNPGGTAIGAIARIDFGVGYEENEYMDFCPGGILAAPLSANPTHTTVTLAKGWDLGSIEIGMLATLSGTEIVRIDGVSGLTITVARGCLDTTPQWHLAEAGFVVFDSENISDDELRLAGKVIQVRLQTRGPVGVLPLDLAPVDVLTYAKRAIRPYPPGQLQIDWSYNPPVPSGSIHLTWAVRNRLKQKDIIEYVQGDFSLGAESGTTYRVEAYKIANSGAVDATPFDINDVGVTTAAYFVPGLTPPPAGTEAILFKVVASRDGFDCWQAATLASPLTALSIAGTPIEFTMGSFAAFNLTATGGIPSYRYSLVSGTLPPGITLDPVTGAVGGIATEEGSWPGLVFRVTDLYGNTDDLTLTLTVGEATLPASAIVLDFAHGIYLKDGAAVPMTDLLVPGGTIVPGKGLSTPNWMVGGYPYGTDLLKASILALLNSPGASFAVEIDYDGATPTRQSNILTLNDPSGNGIDGWEWQSIESYPDGKWDWTNVGNTFNERVWPGINRCVFTVGREGEPGVYWVEYALMGDYGRALGGVGRPDPFEDDHPPGYYFGDSIDQLSFGGNYDDGSTSQVYIRSIEIYPALDPDQQRLISAAGIPFEIYEKSFEGSAAVGQPYLGAKITAYGGTPPYTYAVNSGALPPGLTVNLDGSISGTPTSTGIFTFAIRASDSVGATETLPARTITVTPHWVRYVGERDWDSNFTTTISSGYELGAASPNRVVVVPQWADGVYEVYIKDTTGGDDFNIAGATLMEKATRLSSLNTDQGQRGAQIWSIPWPTGTSCRIFWRRPTSGYLQLRAAIFVADSNQPLRAAGFQWWNPSPFSRTGPMIVPIPGPADSSVVAVATSTTEQTGLKTEYVYPYSPTTLFARAIVDTPVQLASTLIGSSSTKSMAALAIQPAANPYPGWYSRMPPRTCRNYTVDMRAYRPVLGDRLVAIVMHRSALTQVPTGWRLVATATALGLSLTQYTSMYERQARGDESSETWQQSADGRMCVQVLALRGGSDYLALLDGVTTKRDNTTSNSGIFEVAETVGTANRQLAVSGVSSIAGGTFDTYSGAEGFGLWPLSPPNWFTANDTQDQRLFTGWRGLVNGESYSGYFESRIVASADANGIGSVTALMGRSLAIIGNPNLDCQLGSPFTFTVSGTQGTAPYTYSVASGSLPPGLSLNASTGVVSGTPSSVGIYGDIVLRVTDAASKTADLAAFTLVVTDGPLVLELVHTAVSTALNPTFTGVNFGAEHPNRLLLVTAAFVSTTAQQSTPPVFATIGGATARELVRSSDISWGPVNISVAAVPTGTSGSITMTSPYNRVSIAVYRVVNATDLWTRAFDLNPGNGSFTNTANLSLDVQPGDAVFAVGSTATGVSWTPTGELTTDYTVSAGSSHYGIHASGFAATSVSRSFGRPSTNWTEIAGVVIRGNSRVEGRAAGTSTALAIGSHRNDAVGLAAGSSFATAPGLPAIYDADGLASGAATALGVGTRLLGRITADNDQLTVDTGNLSVDLAAIHDAQGTAAGSSVADAPGTPAVYEAAGLASGSSAPLGVGSKTMASLTVDSAVVRGDNALVTVDRDVAPRGQAQGSSTANAVGAATGFVSLKVDRNDVKSDSNRLKTDWS